ncbi:MAG: DUF4956 domain-containing protein, partial [Pyrinomonadaceae bacterium]
MNRLTLAVLGTFVAILLVSGGFAYMLRDRPAPAQPGAALGSAASPTPRTPFEIKPSPETQKSRGGQTLLGDLFGQNSPDLEPSQNDSWGATAARVTLRFALAALLAAILAYRPRRGVPVSRRNPYVGQTQILMAVVASAMMMVVGDSAARAFGIFAAASLVRFRTNIRDPKEITVLLVCLGVGLAAGVGRWDMAIIL